MSLVLTLVTDEALQEEFARQTAPLTLDASYAFEPEDFWEMLPKRPYATVVAETAALDVRPETFVSKVRQANENATVLLLGSPKGDREGTSGIPCLTLPLAEGAVARALARREGRTPSDPLDALVGSGPLMDTVRERIRLFAGVDSTVLLLGESGVGKELLARAVHACSARREGPFVAVSCGAIPSEIIESELFGHVKGAFTGADHDRPGYFELAQGGTLFLDEIGTMRPDHQVRLLRVLQDHAVARVGSGQPVHVDVRVIAATNADLPSLIESGQFREDLFYRLNVLTISVPPLRERREDVPELAAHFVARFCWRNGLRDKTLAPATMERLASHTWPGNVRELENAVEHAMVLSRGRDAIDPMDLPGRIGERRRNVDRGLLRLTSDGIDLNATVSRIEREMILQSLALAQGNKSRAAELLHLKRTTFIEKMRRLELLETAPVAG